MTLWEAAKWQGALDDTDVCDFFPSTLTHATGIHVQSQTNLAKREVAQDDEHNDSVAVQSTVDALFGTI